MTAPARPARHVVTDFAASVAMALTIGVATSVALASAVVLIAQESGAGEPGLEVPVADAPGAAS